MSIQGFELGDKVKVKNNESKYKGHSGRVTSIIYIKNTQNIGVKLDIDKFDPTPFYFNANELDKIS